MEFNLITIEGITQSQFITRNTWLKLSDCNRNWISCGLVLYQECKWYIGLVNLVSTLTVGDALGKCV